MHTQTQTYWPLSTFPRMCLLFLKMYSQFQERDLLWEIPRKKKKIVITSSFLFDSSALFLVVIVDLRGLLWGIYIALYGV